eukprot:TRINITY_DN3350_c9_g1_i1.p1 TRINITY_DN3350_c9_g1~~TRINITY_DN3350_c9_g1_i1.p1  ORF type:complete len:1093 (-),score=246.83 TRINITY_DN3350_c9_g1_i1:102-3380(-)
MSDICENGGVVIFRGGDRIRISATTTNNSDIIDNKHKGVGKESSTSEIAVVTPAQPVVGSTINESGNGAGTGTGTGIGNGTGGGSSVRQRIVTLQLPKVGRSRSNSDSCVHDVGSVDLAMLSPHSLERILSPDESGGSGQNGSRGSPITDRRSPEEHHDNLDTSTTNNNNNTPVEPHESRAEKMASMREVLVTQSYITRLVLNNGGSGEEEELARELMAVFYVEKKAVQLRDLAISVGVSLYKRKPHDLLRSTNIYIALLSEFMRLLGQSYLVKVLKPHVKRIAKEDLEIDPQRLRPDENYQKNLERLTETTRDLITTISRSVTILPPLIKQMLVSLYDNLQIECDVNFLIVLSSVLFLRFICPALVSPKHFNVVHEAPNPKARRNLVLVTKLLQLVANNKMESLNRDQKESFLSQTQPMIKECIPLLERFSQDILEEKCSDDEDYTQKRKNIPPECGKKLFKWLTDNKTRLCTWLIENENLHCKLGFEHFLTKYASIIESDDESGNQEGSWILRNPLNLLKKGGKAPATSPRNNGSSMIIKANAEGNSNIVRSGSGVARGSHVTHTWPGTGDRSPRTPSVTATLTSWPPSPDKVKSMDLDEIGNKIPNNPTSSSAPSLTTPAGTGTPEGADKKETTTKQKNSHRLTMDFSLGLNLRGKFGKSKDDDDIIQPLSARGIKGEIRKDLLALNLSTMDEASLPQEHHDLPYSPRVRQTRKEKKKAKKEAKEGKRRQGTKYRSVDNLAGTHTTHSTSSTSSSAPASGTGNTDVPPNHTATVKSRKFVDLFKSSGSGSGTGGSPRTPDVESSSRHARTVTPGTNTPSTTPSSSQPQNTITSPHRHYGTQHKGQLLKSADSVADLIIPAGQESEGDRSEGSAISSKSNSAIITNNSSSKDKHKGSLIFGRSSAHSDHSTDVEKDKEHSNNNTKDKEKEKEEREKKKQAKKQKQKDKEKEQHDKREAKKAAKVQQQQQQQQQQQASSSSPFLTSRLSPQGGAQTPSQTKNRWGRTAKKTTVSGSGGSAEGAGGHVSEPEETACSGYSSAGSTDRRHLSRKEKKQKRAKREHKTLSGRGSKAGSSIQFQIELLDAEQDEP